MVELAASGRFAPPAPLAPALQLNVVAEVWIPPRKNQQKTYCNIISLFSDVVDTAASTPGFKTLVKLVEDFDLVDTLKKANAVTIFAPTDDAFDKLPPGILEKLTKQEAKEVLLT